MTTAYNKEDVTEGKDHSMEQLMMVSILCMTYNHEAYIRDALDGFLQQRTDFLFEVIIHDDASTDRTAEIVRYYEKKRPDIIHAIYEIENQFSKGGSSLMKEKLFPLCKGKYIAICEGDDCWIDTQKLQIQVDYMESYPDCSMYLHNALWIDCQEGRLKVGNPFELAIDPKEYERRISAEEVIMQKNGHPPTASFFFRREMYGIEDFFFYGPVGDYTLLLAALTKGYIYYNGRVMSVYRYRREGSYTQKLYDERLFQIYFNIDFLEFLCKYDEYTCYKLHKYLSYRMQFYAYSVLEEMKNFRGNIYQLMNAQARKRYLEDGVYNSVLHELDRLQNQVNNNTYISYRLKELLQKYHHIWIMGAGKFAALMASQLRNNNIDFEGFAVTNCGEGQTYLGKSVRKLRDVATREKGSILFLIGIKPLGEQRIQESLKEAGIEDYINPFEFHCNLQLD